MTLLAVSFALPPMPYPQAIQIGRLLAALPETVVAVSGAAGSNGDDGFDRRLAFHVKVAHRPRLCGTAQWLATRLLPFYGRSPDEYASWVEPAETALMERLSSSGIRPGALATFGEPMSDHLLGLRLKQRLDLPWIAHFSDPWVDNPFRRHEPFANIVNRRLEREVIVRADRVVFTSAETQRLVMAKYPESWSDKTRVLGHSFDPSLYPDRRAAEGGPLVVRYLGNFYGHRTPIPLFRALLRLLRVSPEMLEGVVFELVGGVPKRMLLHPAFKALPAGLVRIVGSVPYAHSLELMVTADLLLVIDGPDDHSVFLPSKLIDYLGAGTPVFGIVPPGTSALLLKRLGGASADPRKTEDVATGLGHALGLIRRRRQERPDGPWGDPAVRGEFLIGRIATAFSGMLAELK